MTHTIESRLAELLAAHAAHDALLEAHDAAASPTNQATEEMKQLRYKLSRARYEVIAATAHHRHEVVEAQQAAQKARSP